MNIGFNRGVWVLAVALMQLFTVPAVSAAEKKGGEGNAAIVNGKPITHTELDREMAGMLREWANRGKVPEEAQMELVRRGVLEELINRELLTQEGKKMNIRVDGTAVNERLQAVKGRFPNDEEFRNALKRSNLSESDLRAQIERGVLVQEVISKEVVQKVTISTDESKAFYDSHPESFKQPEQIRASHILIKVDRKAETDQKAKARWEVEELRKKLGKGGDFAALAKEHSQCPSKEKGGDLGFFGRGQMVKPFEDAAFSLKPGQTSGIVETEFGYHLIRVTEKKPEKTVSYEEAKEELEKHLKDTKVRTEVGHYIEGLRAKSKVERFLPEIQK